ncbi:MAG: S8 family serine peptidase [Pseudomonadota bacterium]
MRRKAPLLALLGSVAAAAGPAAAQPEQISVRVPSQVSAAVVGVLREIARPVPGAIAAGARPEDALALHCGGSFSPSILDEFRRLNPSLTLDRRGVVREVLLPPCPRVATRQGAVVESRQGDDLATLVAREMGARLDDPMEVECPSRPPRPVGAQPCTALVRDEVLRRNSGDRSLLASPLRPGTRIQLPAVTRATTVFLNDGVTPETAVAALRAILPEQRAALAPDVLTPPRAYRPPALSLVTPLDAATEHVGQCDRARLPPEATWPLDRTALIERLRIVVAEARRQRTLSRDPVTIRVADTGFLGLGAHFPTAFLATGPAPPPGLRPLVNPGFVDAIYGIDPDRGGSLAPPDYPRLGDRTHGTHVADLALGGLPLRHAYADLSSLTRLSFARLWRGQDANFRFESTMLTTSLRWHPPRPSVVNLSVGGNSPIEDFEPALQAERHVLTVIAAGNDDARLDAIENPVFPAEYVHGPAASQVIVVGGHAPREPWSSGRAGEQATSFHRARQSNYGSNSVDLLAPGCLLRGHWGTGEALLIGTSYAAPLVSFTAGLLFALGLDTPAQVKARILASADYIPGHEDWSRYAAILNPESAIRIFEDVARRRDGSVVAGIWAVGASITLCNSRYSSRTIKRIDAVPMQDGGTGLRLIYSVNASRHDLVPPQRVCAASGPGLVIEENGQDVTIPWNQLRDFVPAHRVPPRY